METNTHVHTEKHAHIYTQTSINLHNDIGTLWGIVVTILEIYNAGNPFSRLYQIALLKGLRA